MRQLVLIDDAVVADPALLAGVVGSAPLGAAPVVALDAATADLPAEGPPVTRLGAGARPWVEVDLEEFQLADGRKIIVANHHDGVFLKAVDKRTRSLLTHCDMLLARCPPHRFLAAARFYEPSLFALTGHMREAHVTAAMGYLSGLVDRLRAGAAQRRHRSRDGMPREQDAAAVEALVLTNDRSVGEETAVEEGVLFETRPGWFGEDAARIGLDFIADKIRYLDGDIELLQGDPGIAMFGPYLRLGAGRYRLQLSVDAGGASGLQFTLEAVWGGGSNSLGAFVYSVDEPVHAARAVLTFDVDGSAVEQPVEFRLWNAAGAPPMRLKSLRLTRVLT